MASTHEKAAQRKGMTIAGWVLTILPGGFLLFSAAMKFVLNAKRPEDFLQGMEHIGWTADKTVPLGIVEAVCTILYLVPRTAVLGAILLTGYMGGAIATHVRVNDAVVVQVLIGVVLWLALFLRDSRVRALAPIVR